jgi:large repetitive protein
LLAGGTTKPLAGAPTAAGTYEADAYFAGSADYAAASAMTTFAITPAAAKIAVSDKGGTFNGQPFPATATVAGVVAGVDNTPSASLEGVGLTLTYYVGSTATGAPLPGAPSAARTYTVAAAFAGSADYAATVRTVTFVIKAATPKITVSDKSGTFNGQPFGANATMAGVVPGVDNLPSATLEGVGLTLTYYAGNTGSGTLLAGAPSAAGTYTVVASFAGSADYAARSVTTTFVIKKATAKLTLTAASRAYDGQPFATVATVAGVVAGLDSTPSASLEGVGLTLTYYSGSAVTATLLPGAPSAAGTYTVVVSFAGSADYAAASRSTTFTVKKATPAFSLLTSATISMGTATTILSGTVSLGSVVPTGQVTIAVDGVSMTAVIQADGSFSVTFATGSLAIGRHSIIYSYPGDDNFNPVSGKGTLTVTP